MNKFYLIRHGQKMAIPFDPPLTTKGTRQAEATAEHLKNTHFHEVLSSPKLRTIQTSEIIAKALALSISVDERLIERLEWEDTERFDEFMKAWNKTDIDRKYLPKNGVSSKANGERMKQLLDELS